MRKLRIVALILFIVDFLFPFFPIGSALFLLFAFSMRFKTFIWHKLGVCWVDTKAGKRR